ncbi:MAG: AIR synthase related protein [Lachnospiraceae bacterium]
MRLGKVSQTIMNRSVLKQLPETKTMETFGDTVISNVSLYGPEEQIGVYAAARAVNEVLIKGAKPTGLKVTILLPAETDEIFLKAVVSHLASCSKAWGIPILSAQAEVCPIISQTMIQVTAAGTAGEMEPFTEKPVGWDIVLTKWIGIEGTLRILRKEREALSKRFAQTFLWGIDAWQEMMFARSEIELARDHGAKYLWQVAEGGIFAALWDLAAETGTGLEVRMEQIPIRQETVELCEYFRINPYQLVSSGCILMLTENGGKLTDILSGQGVKAAVLGKTTGSREKVIFRGEEKRFLDRPAPDERLKLFDCQKQEENDD